MRYLLPPARHYGAGMANLLPSNGMRQCMRAWADERQNAPRGGIASADNAGTIGKDAGAMIGGGQAR